MTLGRERLGCETKGEQNMIQRETGTQNRGKLGHEPKKNMKQERSYEMEGREKVWYRLKRF